MHKEDWGTIQSILQDCFVPLERAKLLTYHHLHPSSASIVLSQALLGNADSLRDSNEIVPVELTGTKGRRPSMEDTLLNFLYTHR